MTLRTRVLVSLGDEAEEYERLQADEARAAGARLGLDVEVRFSGGDVAVQLRHVEAAARAPEGVRPGAIVVQPLAFAGLEQASEAALRAGVDWVSMGPTLFLDHLRARFPDRMVSQVTVDNREMGRLQARLFQALLPAGGRVLYIEGPSVAPATLRRREGVLEVLGGSQVEITKTLTGDWSERSGDVMVSFWLSVPARAQRPDLVAAQNDLMAAGARRALERLRPEWLPLPFTGCDGLPEGGQRLVRERVLRATVVQPTTTAAALELVARAQRGEAVPPIASLPPRILPALEELRRDAPGVPQRRAAVTLQPA